jgi:hypothetical protein
MAIALDCQCKGMPFSTSDVPGMMYVTSKPASPLLECVASEAFFTLPMQFLKELAEYLDVPGVEGGTLCELLCKLCKHILKCDDARLAQILQLRQISHGDPGQADLYQLEAVEEALDQEERELIREEAKKVVDEKAFQQHFDKEVQEVRRKLLGVTGKVSASWKNPKSPLAGHKQLLVAVPQGAITQQEAKNLLPPGAVIWQGKTGRWQSHLKPHKSFSKSWRMGGEAGLRSGTLGRSSWPTMVSEWTSARSRACGTQVDHDTCVACAVHGKR